MANSDSTGNKDNYYSPLELRQLLKRLERSRIVPIHRMASQYVEETVAFFQRTKLPKSSVDIVLKDVVVAFAMELGSENERDEGLRYFYTTHRKALFAYLDKYVPPIAFLDQEEIVQDTYLVFNKLARSGVLREDYLANGKPAIAALYGILKIKIKKYIDEKSKNKEVILDEDMSKAAEIPDSAFDVLIETDKKIELEHTINNCFHQDHKYCPDLLKQLFYYDTPLDEYAQKVRISEDAARKRKSRCVKRLKICLGLPPDDTDESSDDSTTNTDEDMDNKPNQDDDKILKDALRQAENLRIRGMLSEWEEAERTKEQAQPKRFQIFSYWRIAASLLMLIAAALFIHPPKADRAIVALYDDALRLSIPSAQKGATENVPIQSSDSLFTLAKKHILNKQYSKALFLLEAMPSASHSDDLDFLLLLTYLGLDNEAESQMMVDRITNNSLHKYAEEAGKIKRLRSWRIQSPDLTN